MLLTDLFVYPVKSLRGGAVPQALVERRGLAGDRRFMIVDESGRFLTQRHLPAMARIAVESHSGHLLFRYDGEYDLAVAIPEPGTERRPAVVWNDTVPTLDAGEEAAFWFTSVLGRACRLVLQDGDAPRAVDPRYAISPDDEVSLADGYPILVTSLASLDDLNRRLDKPVPMDRFRPNLVVSGGEPYEEDGWKRLRVGEVDLALVKPCARCAVTTIDQSAGVRAAEPLRTLTSYRSFAGRVLFGMNAIPLSTGIVRVGDAVDVIE